MDNPNKQQRVPSAQTGGGAVSAAPRTSSREPYTAPLSGSRSTGLGDRPNQHLETITRLDGSVVPLNVVNQERRQASVYGREPTAADPKISNEMMAALPRVDTRAGSGYYNPNYSPEAIRGIQSGLDTVRQRFHNPLNGEAERPPQPMYQQAERPPQPMYQQAGGDDLRGRLSFNAERPSDLWRLYNNDIPFNV